MRRGTDKIVDTALGQHLALAVAAQLARAQVVPNAHTVYDARHLSDMLDVVADALVRVCPIYVRDGVGEPRELPAAELAGATVGRGATVLTVRDGRSFSSVFIKRADLRRGIAVLNAVGVGGLGRPTQVAALQAPDRSAELQAAVEELERLLHTPLLPAQMERASQLLVSVARAAPQGRIANTAMQLMSVLHEMKGGEGADERRVSVLLAHLRASLDQVVRN